MLTIAKLFGKSPFAPLQTHMKKVSSCIKKLSQIFQGLETSPLNELEQHVEELGRLEHEADLTKNDIRNHLPKSLFLPIDRHQLLEILSIQDRIADKAEDIGNLLILHPVGEQKDLFLKLKTLFEKNEEAFRHTRQIVKEMDELLESSFGGMEAERVKTMIDQTALKEHEADKLKHQILKEFFKIADDLTPSTFYIFVRLAEEINEISHTAETLANRIRILLELK